MKHNTVLALATVAIIFIGGCKDVIQEGQTSNLKQFAEEPISINWQGDRNDGIQNYQAKVEIYRMNSRRDTAAALNQTYRIAVRNTDEKIVSRIDFDFDESIPFRSILSDGEEAIAFNPETEEIGHRIQLNDSDSPLHRIFGNQTGMSRINLSLIRKEASRLSLDMQEEENGENKTLLLEIPPALIPQNGLDNITRSRAVFDITEEILLETEVIMVRQDGTTVTTTATPVYEEKDGIPVKVGMITVIDSKDPNVGEIESDTPVYNSPDDVPTVTQQELEEMRANGGIHDIPDIVFGNPNDLSYTETTYEVYRDIEINSVPESLFRLIQNKKE